MPTDAQKIAARVQRHHAGFGFDLATGIGTLTIQNSKSVNILSSAVISQLAQALDQAREIPELRVLILRGSGDRAFTGGADITEMRVLNPGTARTFIAMLGGLCERVRLFPVPVIARISGWCLGGGLELAASCDVRIASTTGRFGMPEVEIGIPSVIHAALLPRLIGAARANYLILTGDRIDAPTALGWGLVDKVSQPDDLDTTVAELAGRLAGFGMNVMRQQKRLLREWTFSGTPAAVEGSIQEFCAAFTTGEPQKFMNQGVRR